MSSKLPHDDLEALLLDEQMGLIEPADRERLERALSSDPELRARRDRLAEAVRPLDAWSPSPAPATLVQSVMAHIEASDRTIKFDPTRAGRPVDEEASFMPALMSLREVIAVAASILIIVGVFVPSYYGVRQRAQQAVCSSQLGGIGQGLNSYAADHAGHLPFAGRPRGASWLPASDNPPEPNVREPNRFSNTRHPFLLVKFRYVNPKLMVCPGQEDGLPLESADGLDRDDFTLPSQIGYSWQMHHKTPLRDKLDKFFAIAADRTPFVKDGHLTPVIDPMSNSSAHGDNAGQNVLYLDGGVRWRRTPLCGVKGDNIWQAGHITRYTGVEEPADDTDSFLISPE